MLSWLVNKKDWYSSVWVFFFSTNKNAKNVFRSSYFYIFFKGVWTPEWTKQAILLSPDILQSKEWIGLWKDCSFWTTFIRLDAHIFWNFVSWLKLFCKMFITAPLLKLIEAANWCFNSVCNCKKSLIYEVLTLCCFSLV